MASFLIGSLVLVLRSVVLILRIAAWFSVALFRAAAGFVGWGMGRGCVTGLLSLAVVVGAIAYVLVLVVTLLLWLRTWLFHVVAGIPHLLAVPVLHGPPWLTATLVVLGGLVLARVAITIWATRRTLATRQAWALVPTRSFDVTLPIVEMAASQLGHIQRRLFGWTDRRASALTIRLNAVEGGQLLYAWEASARAASVLGVAARVYHEVELRPLNEEMEVLAAQSRLGGGADA